jgi:uncharacterized membrane protein
MTPPVKPATKGPGLSQRNIDSIVQLEQGFLRERTTLDRLSDRISTFVGSIYFVIAHVLLISAWVLVNVIPNLVFDTYPFQFMNLVLAVETVFLSTFVLMSQNRQTRQADRWAQIDLQISLLAEQEATKMLQMLQKICDRLGLDKVSNDKELKEMIATTHVEILAGEIDQAREAIEEALEADPDATLPKPPPRAGEKPA